VDGDDGDDQAPFLSICSDMGVFDHIAPMGIRSLPMVDLPYNFPGNIYNLW